MKTFDEWFEENKQDGDVKWRMKRSWQAAQEVQRESDAYVYENSRFCSVNSIKEAIRNNKAV